jgi:hypothetical protein
VHLGSCRCSLCTISCRCSSVLVVLCSVLDVVLVFSRLIPLRSKWCEQVLRWWLARFEGKIFFANGGSVILCRYILAV